MCIEAKMARASDGKLHKLRVTQTHKCESALRQDVTVTKEFHTHSGVRG